MREYVECVEEMARSEEKERVVGQQNSVEERIDIIIEELLILLQDASFIHDDVSNLN